MKVGMMTWYTYYNYGTSLQAVALYNVLIKLGYKPSIINYKPKGNVKVPVKIKKICKSIIIKLKGHVHIDINNNLFKKFLTDYLTETAPCNSATELKELNSVFDAIVCGSDQIWSPLVFDENYFLSFADNEKIIAYAPSLGASTIFSKEIEKKMSYLIKRFKYLSVRENTGKEIIKRISSMEAQVVLDPTLLLNATEWSKFENYSIQDIVNKKYILCYFLGESDKYLRNIEKFASENNYIIYNIPVFKRSKINKYNILCGVGPSEFLTLIDKSQYIFTDSFHGIIFSINFNKDFYAYRRFLDTDFYNQNSRVYDILEKFNLSDRLIDDKSVIKNIKIKYDLINLKVEESRKESIDFLDNSLKKVIITNVFNNNNS